ncbi:MAG TPA: SRPBCC family protein [Pseudonocardia sp.]|jgi:hypothetical protein
MTHTTVSALAMIDGSVEQVREALADYESVRPSLLTENFHDYELHAGGRGAGTEVSWTMVLGRKKRERRRWKPWDCQIQVDESSEPDRHRLVERDTRNSLVTDWILLPAPTEGRCAVRVEATWEVPDGIGALFERPRQRVAIRQVYEAVLNRLHEHFAPDEDDEPPAKPSKPSAARADASGSGAEPGADTGAEPGKADGTDAGKA